MGVLLFFGTCYTRNARGSASVAKQNPIRIPRQSVAEPCVPQIPTAKALDISPCLCYNKSSEAYEVKL